MRDYSRLHFKADLKLSDKKEYVCMLEHGGEIFIASPSKSKITDRWDGIEIYVPADFGMFICNLAFCPANWVLIGEL